jgi:DNA-binding PadR family transcriptional regulator
MERKLLLLGILHMHQMHGYQLFEFIDHNLGTCTDLKKPTAYFLLNKMAEDGWITEELVQEGNRPPRRVYRLTPLGEAEFERLLRESLAGQPRAVFPGDNALAFLDSLDPTEAQILLAHRREALAQELAASRAVPAHPGSMQLVVDHQIHHLSSELAWLDGVLARLAQPVD